MVRLKKKLTAQVKPTPT